MAGLAASVLALPSLAAALTLDETLWLAENNAPSLTAQDEKFRQPAMRGSCKRCPTATSAKPVLRSPMRPLTELRPSDGWDKPRWRNQIGDRYKKTSPEMAQRFISYTLDWWYKVAKY